MPIGFPAYTEKSVRYRGVSSKKLARLAEEALDELGWRPRRDDRWRFRATVPMQFYAIFLTWGAKFTVEIEDDRLFLRSEGLVGIEWLDVGQHSRNINQFLDRFDDILEDQEDER